MGSEGVDELLPVCSSAQLVSLIDCDCDCDCTPTNSVPFTAPVIELSPLRRGRPDASNPAPAPAPTKLEVAAPLLLPPTPPLDSNGGDTPCSATFQTTRRERTEVGSSCTSRGAVGSGEGEGESSRVEQTRRCN